jgi:molybdopterin-guanine dinucleotide biosynthesis protein A
MPDVSAVVLAGGQSRRLGANKAFVDVGGVPLIRRVLEPLRQVSRDQLIVTNEPDEYRALGVPLVQDVWPGRGSLGGIYSGLAAAPQERALIVGCDMPFLDVRLLRFMILLSADYAVVIPRVDGYAEPLHAVYSKACLEPIKALLEMGNLRIVSFFDRVRVRYLERAEIELFDPRGLSYFNVNTPEDLERARQLAGPSKRRRGRSG